MPASLQGAEEEKHELSQLGNQQNDQENQPALINTSHQPNVIMNQEQVDELAEEHLQPKHMTFAGIPVEAEQPPANSPFKDRNREEPDEKGLSALKELKLMSAEKGVVSQYEQAKIDRRKKNRSNGLR